MNNQHNRKFAVFLIVFALVLGISSCGGGTTAGRDVSALTPLVSTHEVALDACLGEECSMVPWASVTLPVDVPIAFNGKGKLTFSTSSSPSGPWTDLPGGINLSLDGSGVAGISGPAIPFDTSVEGTFTVYYRAHFIPQGVKVNGQQLTSSQGYGSLTVIVASCEEAEYDACNDFNGGPASASFTNNSGGELIVIISFNVGNDNVIDDADCDDTDAIVGGNWDNTKSKQHNTATFTVTLQDGEDLNCDIVSGANSKSTTLALGEASNVVCTWPSA